MDTGLLLSSVSKHILLTEEETIFFTSLTSSKFLPKGSFLLREGEVCTHISFVISGSLKVFRLDDNGVEQITDFLIEEWWAEDLYSFFTGSASQTAIKAIEDTYIIQLSKQGLDHLYKQVPKFERFFRILFQNAYISQKEQIQSMLYHSAAERYTRFLKKKPYAPGRFTQQDIASYLGITPQFLSTMKKRIAGVNVD